MIAEIVMLVGAGLVLVAGIGVVRFDDTIARLHALTKATTLAIVLVLIGGAFALSNARDFMMLLLAAALQALVTPVSGQVIGRATFLSRQNATRVDVIDEFDERADDH